MLVLDIGNTQTVVGYFKNDKLMKSFRLSTDPHRTSDEYKLILKGFLCEIPVKWEEFKSITVSSVVPRVTETILRLSLEKEIINVTAKSSFNFTIKVPEPDTVGADRLVNIEGALKKYPLPFIIVDCGTAITFDVVNSKKEYVGGAITPGIYTAADALFSHASKLFSTTLEKPGLVIGNTTKKSLQSGIVYGFGSLIDGMIWRIKKELQKEDVRVIGTGGQIEIVSGSAASIDTVDRDLTLTGLLEVYKNEKQNR